MVQLEFLAPELLGMSCSIYHETNNNADWKQWNGSEEPSKPLYHQLLNVTLPTKPVSIADLEQIALDKLPKLVRQYYEGGAEDEITLRENITSLQRLNVPFAVGPSAFHRLAGYDGELDVARAAAKRGIAMGLSSSSTSSLEDVIKVGKTAREEIEEGSRQENEGFKLQDSDWWQQLYVCDQRTSDTEDFIQRSEKAGYTALLITVDRPYLGRRLASLREKFELPLHLRRASGEKMAQGEQIAHYLLNPSMHWHELIPWLRSKTKMKILVKGILHPEDAALALKHGLDGVVVSNHGGRQLDAAPATIDALPAIADVIQGRIPIFFDGGIRKGLDVYRALALGADVVLLGRAVLWGLAAAGEEGVGLALDIIAEEFKLVMALTGVTDITQIRRSTLALVDPAHVGLKTLSDPSWEDRRPI
ncbi:hypothetical protein L486_01670 [Kwoniella mangroviensis CBS 10435]|uniref:FMN hydroxy acid dehydrogenase domain-containing protein n=1 Tax=Kwoniella mangroviensis CBS 10435 TaxID=1331196 RepID=A0A1B9J2W3_9TREE|nr:hypothetical protein L486_01670 [Kwoniella mangroviensis CBS 10435]